MLAIALMRGLSTQSVPMPGVAKFLTAVKPVECCIEGYGRFEAHELRCWYSGMLHAWHASLVFLRNLCMQ